MDIPNIIRKLLHKPKQEQALKFDEHQEKTIIHSPPVLIRLENQNTEDESNRHFITYGWRRGAVSTLAAAIDDAVFACVNGPGKWDTTQITTLSLDPWLKIRAVQISNHENFTYVGKPPLVLFMPTNAEVRDQPIYSQLSGGITNDFNELLKLIAFKMRAKIVTVESSSEEGILVVFNPWDNNYHLRQLGGEDTVYVKE